MEGVEQYLFSIRFGYFFAALKNISKQLRPQATLFWTKSCLSLVIPHFVLCASGGGRTLKPCGTRF